MSRIKINRWAYLVTVVLVAIVAGVAKESGYPLAQVALGLALPVLTFPMGVLGALCSLPLIYMGIATIFEAHLVAAPVYAVAGLLQWYFVFPRLFRKRSNPDISRLGAN